MATENILKGEARCNGRVIHRGWKKRAELFPTLRKRAQVRRDVIDVSNLVYPY